MEILELLPEFFTATEWAKGPSQTCRALNSMLVPSLKVYLGLVIPWEEVRRLWDTQTSGLLHVVNS